MNDIYETIARKYEDMSKTQKKIADYILSNQEEVSFMTVGRLAAAAAVSEASVVRFATFLGFGGYTHFQEFLQQHARRQMKNSFNTIDRLTLSYDTYRDREQGLVRIFNDDISHIAGTLENLDTDMFFHIVDALVSAPRIVIVCARSVMGLGIFLEYYLRLSCDQVYLVDDLERNEALLNSLGAEDLVLALSFKRYTRRTVRLLEYVSRKDCTIACITDYLTSPLIRFSRYYLLAQTELATYLDSFAAPQTIINGLLTYVGKAKNQTLEKRLSELEEMWDDLDVFMV